VFFLVPFDLSTSTRRSYLIENTATQLYWGMEFARESQRFVGLKPDRHSHSLFLVPKNLLGAIWLQFAKIIECRSEIHRCVVCKNVFASGGGRQTARRADARCCSDRRFQNETFVEEKMGSGHSPLNDPITPRIESTRFCLVA
jgi:hypothetical protein